MSGAQRFFFFATASSRDRGKAALHGSDRIGLALVLHSFSEGGSEAALRRKKNAGR
jgi:hypothetical protein